MNFILVALKNFLAYNSCFIGETMIAYLSGTIFHKETNNVVIDVGGVGYDVTIPLSTFYDLDDVGGKVSLRIHTVVREDSISLFGFQTALEKDLFLHLISVSGIGPKSAITALSGMSADEIISAIRHNNLARLNSIPGVGKKTAERIVIELRDKIVKLSGHAASAVSDAAVSESTGDSVFDDSISALVNLGYQRQSAERAVKSALQEGVEPSVQKLLRRSLQLLAKG